MARLSYRCVEGWSDLVLIDGQRQKWCCIEYFEGRLVEKVGLGLIDLAPVRLKMADEARRGHGFLLDRLMKVDLFRAPPVISNEFNWLDQAGVWNRRYSEVADGAHRLAAAEARGWATVDLEIIRFWFWPRSGRPTDRLRLTCPETRRRT